MCCVQWNQLELARIIHILDNEDLHNSDQASDAVDDTNMGLKEAPRNRLRRTIRGCYGGYVEWHATMRSVTNTIEDNGSVTGVYRPKDRMIELVRACDEERWRNHIEETEL